jgi:SAM-dependent methyltransferase
VLVCPIDRRPLDERLRCDAGHTYPRVASIPVLVTDDEPTHGWCGKARTLKDGDFPAQRLQHGETPLQWVQRHAVATCGNLYAKPPADYPIPSLPDAINQPGGAFLEIGSAWGRWCIAASRAGYSHVVAVDPFVPALEVGRQVADELGARVSFVSADGRHLPFADATFDVVFSYSVFQHWSKPHVRQAVAEIRRVLRPGGQALVQITNQHGAYGLAKRWLERRGLREKPDIRYWTPDEIRAAFAVIGPTRLLPDGFFTLNPRVDDLGLLPLRSRAVIRASEALRHVPGSAAVADSVFVQALADEAHVVRDAEDRP